jgi:hypothetical protein
MSCNLDRRALLRVAPLALVLPAVQARAQTLQDIDTREQAVYEAWEKTPLTIRRAMFVAEGGRGYGMADSRPSSVFKPGEKLISVIEPIGYGWLQVGPQLYKFGFDIDFTIAAKDSGKVLGGQKDFGHFVFQSPFRNTELMLTQNLNVSGAPPGDYVLEYTLRDITGPKSATVDLPFTIAS